MRVLYHETCQESHRTCHDSESTGLVSVNMSVCPPPPLHHRRAVIRHQIAVWRVRRRATSRTGGYDRRSRAARWIRKVVARVGSRQRSRIVVVTPPIVGQFLGRVLRRRDHAHDMSEGSRAQEGRLAERLVRRRICRAVEHSCPVMSPNDTGVDVVCWDWNGTLLDDTAVALAAMNVVLDERGLPVLPDVGAYRQIFGFPVQAFYARLGITDVDFRLAAGRYLEMFASHVGEAHLHDDAAAVLSAVERLGVAQVLISAGGVRSSVYAIPTGE